MEMNQDKQLKNEIVEADGSGFAVQKGTGSTTYLKRQKPQKKDKHKQETKRYWANKDQETRHGRFAVVRGRFSKAAILKPLKPRPHKKGGPGSGETVPEFSRVVAKHVDPSTTVAGTDAGAAVVNAFTSIGVPAATARHSLASRLS